MARQPKNRSDQAILQALESFVASGALNDCPLPELYRSCALPRATVGTFHDALRRLHDSGRVYLHPWTGPLYEMPEPAFALLVGHEIAYYASPRLPAASNGLEVSLSQGR